MLCEHFCLLLLFYLLNIPRCFSDVHINKIKKFLSLAKHEHLKSILIKFDLKMPQFAIPLRLILLGKSQTPSIVKVLGVLQKKIVCQRIMKALET